MLFSSRKTEKLLGKLDKKSIHLSAFSYELIQVTQKRIFKIGKVFKSYRLLNDNSILYKCFLSIQKIVRHFVKCVLIQPILKNPSMVLSFIQQEFTEHIFYARHPSRFCGYSRKQESVLWSTESNRGDKRQLENHTNKCKITLW